jgi:hypothetical protein
MKKQVQLISLKHFGVSKTRTEAQLSTAILRIQGIEYRVFVKISDCKIINDGAREIANNKINAKQSPSYVETKFFKLTNNMNEQDVCRSFVYCFNEKSLITSLLKTNDGYKTMLITEDITSFIPFHVFIKTASDLDISHILFQLMYSLQCMNMIHMTHTDLHFGNMYVMKRPELSHMYDRYTFNTINKGYKSIDIRCTHQLKIIDLDGAHKQRVFTKRFNHKRFTHRIPNVHQTWGNTSTFNKRFDLIKVLFHLYEARPDLRRLLMTLGIKNSAGTVPFYTHRELRTKFKNKIHPNGVDYGMFFNKKGDFLKLSDNDVHTPKRIMETMYKVLRHDHTTSHDIHDTLNQKNLY